MAEAKEITRLRSMLGETIPEGGVEGDTLFTDEQVAEWIDTNPDLQRAAYDGWRAKAAAVANLVDVTDGAASRKFSDLLNNATRMVTLYSKSSSGPTTGRARVGRIVRQQ